jgi:(E)-4-hydroxy-3-methylbut-2-enyl-diphosphate synthase
MEVRKKTRPVKAGRLIIGGGFPVSVQTMWKMPLEKDGLSSVAESLERLSLKGCDIVRFAVPDLDAAELLGRLSRMTEIPLVADIHFDYRLALKCLDFPIAKIRINPGNIGDSGKVREVVSKAAGQGVALRVGVNEGSLPKSLENEKDAASAMLKAAEMEMEPLASLGFTNAVFSLKSSDVAVTVRANRLFSDAYDFPLHIGVTEAGPLIQGIVKNTVGITELLKLGIGDTVRVSLTGSSDDEVLAGNEILRNASLRDRGINLISCPKCGRTSFEVKEFLDNVSEFIQTIQKPLTIAVMGCVVNGPNEAKRADIGITGAGQSAIIFKHGKIVKKVPYPDAVNVFMDEVKNLCGRD